MPNSVAENNYIIINLLKETGFKTRFSTIMKSTRKYYQTYGTASFLEQCLTADYIPKTFRIKNLPRPDLSLSHQEKWTEGAKQASKTWMLSSIQDLRNKQENILAEISNVKSELLLELIEEEKIEVEKYYIDKCQFLHNREKKLRENKFKHIKEVAGEKQDRPNQDIQRTKKKNRPGKRTRQKMRQNKKELKRKPISVVFNYSSIELTESMIKLLNRGLNFCIKPLSVNLSNVLVDFKKFERKTKWREFFYGVTDQDYTPPIFKTEKTNLPKSHATPRPLQVFLNTVESNIQNKSKWNTKLLNPKLTNIPQDEFSALQELIRLQRERVIIIKPADKGAGILVINYDDYVKHCGDHLSSRQIVKEATTPSPSLPSDNHESQDTTPHHTSPQPSSFNSYYRESTEKEVQGVKKKILETLEEGLKNEWIEKEDFEAMNPSQKGPGKFYQIFKVHKPHPPSSLPPGRPIISGSGSMNENLSRFVDHHAKDLVQNLPSYIQDTPDFLRNIEELNTKSGKLPENAILVTIDVTGLYTNIPKNDGMSAMKTALNSRLDQSVPTDFLLKLLDIVLSSNIFEFNKKLYCQEIGTAMGTPVAPTFANITMGEIDDKMHILANRITDSEPIKLLKRFIDDYFLIWTGNVETLESFLSKLNDLHPTIKFTYSFTCPFPCDIPPSTPHDCFCHTSRSIPFLDTQVTIQNGQLITDLYRKPTDRCMYLLPSSCHPAHTTKNIPYSLCYRLVRICSQRSTLLGRLEELKRLLLSRDYPLTVIQNAIKRALELDRKECLKKVTKRETERVVFSTDYHPALPSFKNILTEAWKVMTKDNYMKGVFPKPPMIAYRQAKNSSLRNLLVKAKLPDQSKPMRKKAGMKKCRTSKCKACPFIKETLKVKSSASQYSVAIHREVNCDTKNVIYCIYCDKPSCKKIQYIGETARSFEARFREHLGYVRNNNQNQPTGAHFNLPGHSISDMRATIIEQCKEDSPTYRKLRESYLINKFNTRVEGMNQRS